MKKLVEINVTRGPGLRHRMLREKVNSRTRNSQKLVKETTLTVRIVRVRQKVVRTWKNEKEENEVGRTKVRCQIGLLELKTVSQ